MGTEEVVDKNVLLNKIYYCMDKQNNIYVHQTEFDNLGTIILSYHRPIIFWWSEYFEDRKYLKFSCKSNVKMVIYGDFVIDVYN